MSLGTPSYVLPSVSCPELLTFRSSGNDPFLSERLLNCISGLRDTVSSFFELNVKINLKINLKNRTKVIRSVSKKEDLVGGTPECFAESRPVPETDDETDRTRGADTAKGIKRVEKSSTLFLESDRLLLFRHDEVDDLLSPSEKEQN